MKRDKIIYWIATGLVAAGMLMSSVMYLSSNPELMENFKSIGYPPYFVMMLGIFKLLGVVTLIAPVWDRLKEWTYAGFAFTFIGALWTHIATETPGVNAVVFLVMLAVSYIFRLRIQTTKTQ